MTNIFNFYLPTKIIVGDKAENVLPDACRQFGERVLFVCDKALSELSKPVIEKLRSTKLPITPFYFDKPEPTCNFIDDNTKELKKHSFDFIIGFGGGSAIDLAKAFSISLTHSQKIWLYANLSNRPALPFEHTLLPLIAIPTTAGTGSEVTPYSVLTNSDTKQKGTIQDPIIFPKVAILDPELYISLPSDLTASTGIDALAHALESYVNISKYSPACEWAGTEAIKLIFKYLPIAFNEPNNIDARKNMAWASTLAGIAISHRGTTVGHAIAEPLGALTHIPHGLGVSIVTIAVLKHSFNAIKDKLSKLYIDVFQNDLKDQVQNAKTFINELENLITGLNLNKKISDIKSGLDDSFQKVLIENILKYKFRPLKQHPVEFGESELISIVKEIYNG